MAASTSASTAKPKPIKKVKSSARNKGKESDNLFSACPECVRGNVTTSEDHIQCDNCSVWLHWLCVAANPLDEVESIDNFYCQSCTNISLTTAKPLSTTYKAAVRKSTRESNKIDYVNFANHQDCQVEKWIRVLATRKVAEDAFKEYKAEEITSQWAFGTEESMSEPFWISKPAGLGMKMPKSNMTISQIAAIVGPKTPIEVIDVASQASLSNWTLQEWANYYEDPKRDKVRNVISLEVSRTKLSSHVEPPTLVQQLDWVGQFWPAHLKRPGDFPQVLKYCLMSVASCWTDWHVDFAGSSVYYHILRGSKTFYFIRPTPANLAAYEKWSGSSELQQNTWLGDDVDVVYKIDLHAGNTMIIPTGWIHAVYTPQDSLVIGGNFLHSLNIATQLRIHEIEISTKVPKKFRYPNFVKLLWFTTLNYTERLRALDLPPSTNPAISLPLDINIRVLEGLLQLSSFMIEQTSRMSKSAQVSPERRRVARENVPWEQVSQPVSLAIEFRKLVLRALGEPMDFKCATPELDDALDFTSPPLPSSKKRKPVIDLLVAEKKPNLKNWTPTATDSGSKGSEELILSKQEVGETTSTVEMRKDPKGVESMAHVKTTSSKKTVIKRIVLGKSIVVETRIMSSSVEQVTFNET